MKLKLTTTYENVTKEWLWWYADTLINSEDENLAIIAEALLKGNDCGFTTKDPSSDVVGTTEYSLVNE